MLRREFLLKIGQSVAQFSGALALTSCATAGRFGFESRFTNPVESLGKAYLFSVSSYDKNSKCSYFNFWKDGHFHFLPVPLELPHNALALPGERFLLLEQNGPKAVVVGDWPLRIQQEIHLDSGRYFYGHGVVVAKGEYVLTTEIEAEYIDQPGWIIIRRTSDLKELGRVRSHGLNPHDLTLLPDGSTLAVANHGQAVSEEWRELNSNLALIDWQKDELINDFKISGPGVFASHLAANRLGDIVVSTRKSKLKSDTASRSIRALLGEKEKRNEGVRLFSRSAFFDETAPLLLPNGGGKFIEMLMPEVGITQMRHSLSTSFDVSGQFIAISHIENNIVSIWEKNTQKCVRRLFFPSEQAHGIACGQEVGEFYISSAQGRLYRYSHFSSNYMTFLGSLKGGLHLAAHKV